MNVPLWNIKGQVIINIAGGILFAIFSLVEFDAGCWILLFLVNGFNGFIYGIMIEIMHEKYNVLILFLCEMIFLLFEMPCMQVSGIGEVIMMIVFNGCLFGIGIIPGLFLPWCKFSRNRDYEKEEHSTSENDGYDQSQRDYRQESQSDGDNYYAERIELSYFGGCDSREALKKRYRKLAKTFHSDEGDGDDRTFIKMQQEYEQELRKYKR